MQGQCIDLRGPGAVARAWELSDHVTSGHVTNAAIDLLLSCGSPHLRNVCEDQLHRILAENPVSASGKSSVRRQGLFKLFRILTDQRLITQPLKVNDDKRGPQPATLASVPEPWLS